jgi:hypothetical protein
MAKRTRVRSTATVGFEDLVTAWFDATEYEDKAPEHSSYIGKRRDALRDAMGSSFGRPEAPVGRRGPSAQARDRDAVHGLARSCLERARQVRSPFGSWLEGKPGPLESRLRDTHKRALDAAQEAQLAGLRALFVDCLLALETRRIPEEELFARGVPRTAPDPWDYF